MPSSARTSLSSLNPNHPSDSGEVTLVINNKKEIMTENKIKAPKNDKDEDDDVLKVESIETARTNNATEPAQAIINSLSVNPDLEKAVQTKKRRTKKSASKATSKKTTTKSRASKKSTPKKTTKN